MKHQQLTEREQEFLHERLALNPSDLLARHCFWLQDELTAAHDENEALQAEIIRLRHGENLPEHIRVKIASEVLDRMERDLPHFFK